MRSNGLALLLLVFLLLLGGFVYFAHHPDAELLRRAEALPYVGGLATAFRMHYTPPGPPIPVGLPASEAPGTTEVITPPPPPLGEGQVWVLAGTELKRRPDAGAPTILQFDAIANVTRLERRGDWFRVWRHGTEGWVYLEGYRDDGPPYGRDPEPVRPLPPREPDEATLAEALDHLGGAERRLGPYRLFTDSTDEELLALLGRVAGAVEDAYVERTGRRPLGTPKAAVVLYDDEAAYRRLQARSSRLLGLAAGGHTGSGLVIFYAGGRTRPEVAATLLHELTHTLNRRAIGPALPSWLDEGLAEAMSFSRLDEDGRPHPTKLSGVEQRTGNEVVWNGGRAALMRLRERLRTARLPAVVEVAALDWRTFVGPDASLHYAVAGFWIRFLLEAEDGRYRPAFHDYLAAVAGGERASAEELRRRLGASWNVLQARFELWLEFLKE